MGDLTDGMKTRIANRDRRILALEQERDNLRAALEACVKAIDMDIASGMGGPVEYSWSYVFEHLNAAKKQAQEALL